MRCVNSGCLTQQHDQRRRDLPVVTGEAVDVRLDPYHRERMVITPGFPMTYKIRSYLKTNRLHRQFLVADGSLWIPDCARITSWVVRDVLG